MKRGFKIISLLAVIVMSLGLFGCGGNSNTKTAEDKKDEKIQLTVEESMKIAIDAIVFNKGDECKKIGISDIEYKALGIVKETTVKQMITSSGAMKVEYFADGRLETFASNLFDSISKSEITYTNVNLEDKTATVDVNIKGLDMKKIIENTTKDFLAKYMEKPSMDDKEKNNVLFDIYQEKIAEAPLLQDVKVVKVNLTKKDGYWAVDDQNKFAEITSSIISL